MGQGGWGAGALFSIQVGVLVVVVVEYCWYGVAFDPRNLNPRVPNGPS